MGKILIKTEVEIDANRIGDLMITGIEGGIGYWAAEVEVINQADEPVSYQDENVWSDPHWTVRGIIRDDLAEEGEDAEKWSFTKAEFLERIQKAPRWHLTAWLNENEDADTADALIQCAAFGEIVYG